MEDRKSGTSMLLTHCVVVGSSFGVTHLTNPFFLTNNRTRFKSLKAYNNTRTIMTSCPTFKTMDHTLSSIRTETSGNGISKSYETAIDTIATLISVTPPTTVDKATYEKQFALVDTYLKILDLEEPLSQLKVIHVAGTKGKGSTCAFTESILRSSGFRTGLFTSPHLLDICERFRLNGSEISQEKFSLYFWWCWERLQANCNDDLPMPKFFHFITLLAFKIFVEEKVDVVILEVGLGGTYDATNVVKSPTVCGISSLGYDHMEVLGNTLREIAGQKAGILKPGVPAITVPQSEEAMQALRERAAELSIPLEIASPLQSSKVPGLKLGLDGEHQYINAALAVALSHTWIKRATYNSYIKVDDEKILPPSFIEGLTKANSPGRSQIFTFPHQIPSKHNSSDNEGFGSSELIFYLDGAHSPESMEVCANWFSNSVKDNSSFKKTRKDFQKEWTGSNGSISGAHQNMQDNCMPSKQILIFNCMNKRDPFLLLPHLLDTCERQGVHFAGAFFVPNQLAYNQVGSAFTPPPIENPQVDLSWQVALQKCWQKLTGGCNDINNETSFQQCQSYELLNDDFIRSNFDRQNHSFSAVMPSLSMTLKWLREGLHESHPLRLQVLVTGSLHLVGDMLRTLKKYK